MYQFSLPFAFGDFSTLFIVFNFILIFLFILIGCTWVPLGLEVVSWRRRNIPISSVDLADLLLPRHLRRCGLAAGGKKLPCVIGVCRVNTVCFNLQAVETRLLHIRILSGRQ
jgi:hypothetical protein